MAYFGGGPMQTQTPPTGWCDYCHQKPKFPPYNYCGKACGSKAKATGSIPSNGPVMCKQCGQKPVYKNHRFCGRTCASNWQAMNGQINTGGHGQPQHGQQSWNVMPPPYVQNPPSNPIQPSQGFNQGGGTIGRGPISQSQQLQPFQPPQQQPGPFNPSHTQHVPGQTSRRPMIISPPISPMSSEDSNMAPEMGGPISPGTFDPMSPGTLTPISPGLNQQYYSPSSPTGPGFQDPNEDYQTNGQHFSPSPLLLAPHITKQDSTPGQKSKTTSTAMNVNPQMNSTGGGGIQSSHDPDSDLYAHADPDQDPTATSNHYPNSNWFPGRDQNTSTGPAQAQARHSIQATSPPTGAGGHGNRNWDPSNLPSQRSTSTSPGPPTTCRLKGCNKPVFVDPVTHSQSEYCSQRHREDAKIFGQVNPCIMCLKMPRGLTDHFCSKACRDKALRP